MKNTFGVLSQSFLFHFPSRFAILQRTQCCVRWMVSPGTAKQLKSATSMATPFVPVPLPIGNSSGSSITTRSQRSSSLGSSSTSSNSSKEPHEDGNRRARKKLSAPEPVSCTSSVCSSPLIRTKFDSSVEYNSRPVEHDHTANSVDLEERPSTPTVLGYEVMEERAKFTVRFIDFYLKELHGLNAC